MERTKFCKVTFYADLTSEDRNYMQEYLADEIHEDECVEIHDLSIVEAGNDRTEELLSSLVDYVSCGRNIHETISVLKTYGFKDAELERMGFSPDDIAVCQIDEDGETED